MKGPHTIHLTGGGPGAFLALRRHFKSALAEIEQSKATKLLVAYVGAASNDNAGFFTMIRTGLALGDTRIMRQVKLASPKASAKDARALLEECDLVFLSGGDVEHGMKVLAEKDMVKTLRALAEAGKPMFGISAGSIMLARDWVRFPDAQNPMSAELFPCLAIAPVHVDAHAEEDNWDELRVLIDLLRQRGDPESVGYGLTRKGGLRLEIDAKEATMEAIGTALPRIGVRRGKVVDLPPLAFKLKSKK